MKLGACNRLAAMVLMASAACSSSIAELAPTSSASMTPYRLGIGDEVRLTVFGIEAMNNTYTVGDTGRISIPLLGTISAQGLTIDELETAIASSLRARDIARTPSVSAQVQKYRPFFILGEVQKPGQYDFVPGMSVLTAVSIAGGYTYRAKTNLAVITRSDAGRAIQSKARPDTLIQPGDTILVRETMF